jgi:transposase-like protein
MDAKANRKQTNEPAMICPICEGKCQRFGKNRNGSARFRCPECKKTYTAEQPKPFGKMSTPVNEALMALGMLLDGASVRSTERLTGLHRDTILKILVKAGEKCEKLMGRLIVNVVCEDVQADEIWGYVSKKEAHKLPTQKDDDSKGDAYCYVAMERHSKLVLNFALGRRNQATTDAFIEGLRHATAPAHRFQITTDGFQPYISAITTTLSDRCDYAQHIKVYGANQDGERRYSPAEVIQLGEGPSHGKPRNKADLHQPFRAPKPHHPYADAPHDPAHECVFKEVGQPVERILPVVRLLQLLPGSPDTSRHSCDGSRDRYSDLEIADLLA